MVFLSVNEVDKMVDILNNYNDSLKITDNNIETNIM